MFQLVVRSFNSRDVDLVLLVYHKLIHMSEVTKSDGKSETELEKRLSHCLGGFDLRKKKTFMVNKLSIVYGSVPSNHLILD